MTSQDIGSELIELGWRQGSLLRIRGARMLTLVCDERGTCAAREHALPEEDLLVVVSQDCDIARSPEEGEAYVEAVRAYWTTDKGRIRAASRNSVRWFLVCRQTNIGVEEGLIADATFRVHIDKRSLLRLVAEAGVDQEDDRTRRRFSQWLGARYSRPALDDSIVEAFQRPIVEAIGRLKAVDDLNRILAGIREILFQAANAAPPYQVELLLMEDEGGGTPADEEEAATLVAWLNEVLEDKGNARVTQWDIRDTSSVSVRDYAAYVRLPLDHFTPANVPSFAKGTGQPRSPENNTIQANSSSNRP